MAENSIAGEAVAVIHSVIFPSFFGREDGRCSNWEGEFEDEKDNKRGSSRWILSWANMCPSLS